MANMYNSDNNFVLKIKNDDSGQHLFFFGATHTNNPNDKQFVHLKELWKEFLKTDMGEKVVLVEGKTQEVSGSLEDTIKIYGETGAVVWLAKKENIRAIRPEPDDEEQRRYLCSNFDPDLVVYALIAQNLSGWFRHTTKTIFEEAVERTLNREAKFADIYGFKPDKEWLESKHDKLFSSQQLNDRNFLESITDPRKNVSMINQIISAKSKMRDEYIFNKITEIWKSGVSIFIVYGKGHLESLKPLLVGLNDK